MKALLLPLAFFGAVNIAHANVDPAAEIPAYELVPPDAPYSTQACAELLNDIGELYDKADYLVGVLGRDFNDLYVQQIENAAYLLDDEYEEECVVIKEEPTLLRSSPSYPLP